MLFQRWRRLLYNFLGKPVKTPHLVKIPVTESIQDILEFWFGNVDSAELGSRRTIWFDSDPEFDETLRQRFGTLHQKAAKHELDYWKESPIGALGLIIILDQFSRNIFRGKAEAFACDDHARVIAEYALTNGFDEHMLTVQKLFFYLPFEHAEDTTLQTLSVKLFVALGDEQSLQHALCHRDQIVRFGQFPDRNKALGRENTPGEAAFLAHPFC